MTIFKLKQNVSYRICIACYDRLSSVFFLFTILSFLCIGHDVID